jgi:integrase
MAKAKWALDPDKLLTEAKYQKLIQAAKILDSGDFDGRACLAFLIAGTMGWRVGEIVHLRIEDIDFDERQTKKIVLKRRADKPQRKLKSISKDAYSLLRRLAGGRESGWLFESHGSSCDVFVTPRQVEKYHCVGGHITKRTVQRWFKQVYESAKIGNVKGLGIHALRHRFAFLAAEKLKDRFRLRDLLDHASAATSDIYVDATDEKDSMRRLEEMS